VIDLFAERNIPIKNMERASGFITTDVLAAARGDTVNADCGRALGIAAFPTNATYNVLVRGDSTTSTVRATVRWVRSSSQFGVLTECSSRGIWETALEAQVKDRAEHSAANRSK
jgi:hypothetical protein